jgi:hypothetical protein
MPDFPQTEYFKHTRTRRDRALILDDWIKQVTATPEREEIQSDGRIRRWARIPEFENKALRVILLEDGLTVHNAFFDRDYEREKNEN